jgi:DNA-binding MarR family transcriptional regulator
MPARADLAAAGRVTADLAADGCIADGANPDDEQLVAWWGLVGEGFTAVNRRLAEDVGRFGLPVTWFEVLLRLRRTPGHRLSASHIAREVSFSSGGFTKLTDRMLAAGLVERTPCPADRRVTWISATEAGLRSIEDATTSQAERLRELVLDALGAVGFEGLAHLGKTLRDHSGGAPEPFSARAHRRRAGEAVDAAGAVG